MARRPARQRPAIPSDRGSPAIRSGARVDAEGHLDVGGCDLVEVAREFGTPAYVYAPDDIRARAGAYTAALRARGVDSEVLYASKAAPITAVYRVCREEGLSVDVASGGELHMALRAGFDPARIYMHGNNKSAAELRMAFEAGIGCIVRRLARRDRPRSTGSPTATAGRADPGDPGRQPVDPLLCADRADRLEVRLRDRGRARRAGDRRRHGSRHLRLAGLHAHLGSQIFELDPYVHGDRAAGRVLPARRAPDHERRRWARDRLPRHDEPPSIEAYVDVKVAASSASSTRCRGS